MIDKPELRRFPPPWSVDEQEACFTVRDATGQALAYVYFEDEPLRDAAHAKEIAAEVPLTAAEVVAALRPHRRTLAAG
jgi:hypothetical protein